MMKKHLTFHCKLTGFFCLAEMKTDNHKSQTQLTLYSTLSHVYRVSVTQEYDTTLLFLFNLEKHLKVSSRPSKKMYTQWRKLFKTTSREYQTNSQSTIYYKELQRVFQRTTGVGGRGRGLF